MLGKLIKYDLRAAGRMLIFLYIAVLAMAVVFGFSLKNMVSSDYYFAVGGTDTLNVIVTIIYIVLLVVMLLLTFVMIVRQFYKNMLCGQGYLMNALPVKTWMHLASKTITGFIWAIVSSIVSILSLLIALCISQEYASIWAVIQEVLQTFPHTLIALYAAGLFVGAIGSVLMIYLALMLGNLFNKHKLGMAILMFIVLLIGTGSVRSVVWMTTAGWLGDDAYLFDEYFMIDAAAAQVVLAAVMAVVFWIVTNWLMKKKLNLD
ncbi:hypothetical protein [Eubacterium oxidoreducens]|uniref:ABC-2 family transporter protein n=1 Tax=Eubacterium oxidoreducens TaxID=1732 RepID=A0A1G6BC64_EUBOX|nr:hypothetical protein [Eubacterium oxidoreducens]SDB18207.1 hypothetical protein SAMN02910417_01346 [Eubacterium oxidoreducens]